MNREIALWLLLAVLVVAAVSFLVARKRPRQVWEITPGGPYEVIKTDDALSCEHAQRPIESIRWDDIREIRLVRTSDGPLLPDFWFVFLGDAGGCSIPSEAKGFDRLFDEFKTRFPGLDYGGILQVAPSEAEAVETVLWKK